MDTKVTTREQISALADGELSSEEMTIALAALRSSERERQAWEVYHQIGDVLRSEDMGVSLSAGFSARMNALLEAEPAIVAPQAPAEEAAKPMVAGQPAAANGDHRAQRPRRLGRFALPGAAAAAAAIAAVFVAMPQQAVVTADSKAVAPTTQVALAPVSVPSAITSVSAGGTNASGSQNVNQLSTLAQQGEVKRDPRIDDYLFAHQRFSSSYSSAQYARSAAFAVDADK